MRRLPIIAVTLVVLITTALALRAIGQTAPGDQGGGPPGGQDNCGGPGGGGPDGGPGGGGGPDGGGPGGPGGHGGPPGGFHLLPRFVEEKLNLTDDQQTQVDALEKETKAKLEKILTPEQLKILETARPPHHSPGGQGGQQGQSGGGQGGGQGQGGSMGQGGGGQGQGSSQGRSRPQN